ncbi:hypothetical protein [Rodentibacter caecimuris]|uniref:hypothetical protein n=1 Tax=Rodentibacter caecimuris TaxID=1796644 RepID=UPI000984A409|nr:hypothetical protein BKG97_05895 [Rodentibacter heylii]
MEKIFLPKDWVCDGSELKPKGGSSRETWIYNGKEIKTKINATNRETWIFDGKELKAKINATSRDTWVVERGIIKPKINATSRNSHDLDGNSLLVAFGQLILKAW